jgi:hypothetical protein
MVKTRDRTMENMKRLEIKLKKGPSNDPRPDVFITLKDGTTLRVAGYDALPHRMKGTNYDRIQWEEFRLRLLGAWKDA